MSQPSARTSAVQFCGSSVACARSGSWYSALTTRAADLMTASASPSRRALCAVPVARGIEHLGQAHVDAVARTAVHLEWGIESPHGGADQAEVPGIGELDVVRHREPGGGLGARAEARALAGRGDHEAVLRAADGGPNAPLPRGGADQHGARLRARPAELQPRIAHAGAAAGDLRAEEVVLVRIARRSEVDADAAEVHSEFFGDERRQRRVDALAH